MSVQFSLPEEDKNRIGRANLGTLEQVYTNLYPEENMLAEVSLVSLGEIQKLNRENRSLDEPTDVLSFPTYSSRADIPKTGEPILIGAIVISADRAERYGETLIQLVHHGLLHLLGYDHETDMTSWQTEEKRILKELEKYTIHIPAVSNDSI